MPEVFVWVICILMMLLGIAGVILPIIPGAELILIASIIHKICLPDYLSWWIIAAMVLLTLLNFVIEWVMGYIGAKWFGACRWGLIGAVVGFLVGFFFPPLGWILGPLAGGFLGEFIFAKRPIKEASKAGLGLGLGVLSSHLIKLGIVLLMILLFILDVSLIDIQDSKESNAPSSALEYVKKELFT
ncbi:MAG: DUF456 domain-containing protein [Verrucomicrobiota bacterium]